MDIGPVLHPDDVMAGKMDALYNRAAARDFLDIDAAITTGRYTLDHLCRLAREADAGFDRQLFAAMLGRIDRLDDEDFTAASGRSMWQPCVNGSRTGVPALPVTDRSPCPVGTVRIVRRRGGPVRSCPGEAECAVSGHAALE